MSWWKKLRGKTLIKEPLARHTTYRIGGPARFLCEPADREDLKLLLKILKRHTIPFFVLGAGSNVLAPDEGVSRAVIRLNAPAFKNITFLRSTVEAGAGVYLGQLIGSCARQGLGGLEFLAGIPGTLGGALVMNAGSRAPGRSISSVVKEVTVMTGSGQIRRLKKPDIDFGYRRSGLSGCIILSARLKLVASDRRRIMEDVKKHITERRLRQDWRPSCGCVFKNPMGISAGRLVDFCGLKGMRAGGACISPKHANFIVNVRRARARDVRALMEEATKKVRRRFGITLEPEVRIWK